MNADIHFTVSSLEAEIVIIIINLVYSNWLITKDMKILRYISTFTSLEIIKPSEATLANVVAQCLKTRTESLSNTGSKYLDNV